MMSPVGDGIMEVCFSYQNLIKVPKTQSEKEKKEIEPIHFQPKNAPFPKWTLTLGFCAIGKDRIQIYSWVKRWS